LPASTSNLTLFGFSPELGVIGCCAKGTKVHYEQYDALSHIWRIRIWLPNSIAWINERFAVLPRPENCSSIAPRNSLKPIAVIRGEVVRTASVGCR